MTPISVRRAEESDAAKIAQVFTGSRAVLAFLPQLHTREEDARFIEHTVLQNCDVFVAELRGQIVGFVAIKDDWLEHLYVSADKLSKGVGSLLLAHAKQNRSRLQLWCFEQNLAARRFYENQGFRLAERTDGSGNQEKCPDIRYVWTH